MVSARSNATSSDTRPTEVRAPARTRPREHPFLSQRLAWILRARGIRVSPDDRRVAMLQEATLEADPLADAYVEFMHEVGMGRGRALLERALEHGVDALPDAPPELVALFAQLDREPAWLDRERVALGTRTVLRHGPDAMCALSAVLMSGYLTMHATKPLVMTSALTEMAGKRLDATARFTMDVYTSGDMRRSSAGFKTTVRVRIMHALVRASLLRSPRWRIDPWGIPINQRDMAATHLQFSMSYLWAVHALGRIDTREEQEAVLHLWRYVSYLLGVRDDLVPKTHREGLELVAIFNATEDGPDADGVALARALTRNWLEGPVAQGPYGAHIGQFLIGFCRYFLGTREADALELADSSWKYAAPLLAVLSLPLELTQLALPRARVLGQRWGAARLLRAFSGPSPFGAPRYHPYDAAAQLSTP